MDVPRKTAFSAPLLRASPTSPTTCWRAGICRSGETRNRNEDTTIFSCPWEPLAEREPAGLLLV